MKLWFHFDFIKLLNDNLVFFQIFSASSSTYIRVLINLLEILN